MATEAKTHAVADIAEEFRTSSAALLTEYRGLTVSQLTELRRALGAGTRYAIVKNSLTRIAARDAGVEGVEELLTGPTAIAFVKGDAVLAAKGVRDFARTYPLLVVKGGILDGRPVSAAEISKLADLESRDVLLAKLAGAMTASLSQAVSLFAAPLSKTARLAEALRQQREDAGETIPAAPDPEPTAPSVVLEASGSEVPSDAGAPADVPQDTTE